MKRILGVLVVSAGCAVGQTIDLSSLDKLASRAKEVNRVSLDRDQLRAALSMLSGADSKSVRNLDQVKSLVERLNGVEVRNFEFGKTGQYSDSDLVPVREQLGKLKGCSKIIDSKEDREHSEIFLCMQDGKTTGLAVLSAEETELSVVLLKGPVNLKDLGSLGGIMGLPSAHLGPRPRVDVK